MALLTLTYEYKKEQEAYSIICLDTDEIYTHCYKKEEIRKNAIEASELILEDYIDQKVPLKNYEQHTLLESNQFQLVFDMATGKHLKLVTAED